jgi:hypothetical protein
MFKFSQGGQLRKGLDEIEVQINGVAKEANLIARFYDLISETENEFISPKGQFIIEGARIKIAGDDPECGLYFVSLHYPDKVEKISPKQLAVNTPSKLVGVFRPDFDVLGGEEWKVVVKTQFGGSNSKLLKEPRSIEFDRILMSP